MKKRYSALTKHSSIRSFRTKRQEPLANVAEATRGAAAVDVLVGGPMTALNALATSDPDFAGKIAHVRAMAAAWDCSTANLFANQFNCAADLCVEIKSSSRLQCARIRMFRRTLFG